MEEAGQRLHGILDRVGKLGVPTEKLGRLEAVRRLLKTRSGTSWRHSVVPVLVGVMSVTLALVHYLELYTHHGFSRAWLKWHQQDLYDQMCTITMPDHMLKLFRPPEDCSICRDIKQVDKVVNISPQQFEETYAYTGRPVVVMDAMGNWTAQHMFSYQFFKGLYEQKLEHWSLKLGCQFFPYDTEFTQLREVFNMSEDRALMLDGTKPWYIGWSNCDERIARVLRQHYGRPYFLPTTAENKKVDWIFMGSPGYGAHMHVDNVEHPSWQAQLKGRKKWVLQPPPECYYHCGQLEVIVEQGEIIVLDTNRWFHQTLIVSDDMSITIGAEYD